MNTNSPIKNLIALIVLDVAILIISLCVLAFRFMTLSGSATPFEIGKSLSALRPSFSGPEHPLDKAAHNAGYDSENNTSDLPGVNEIPDTQVASQAPPLKAAQPAHNDASTRRIGFTFFNSKCKKVEVIGDFNNWAPAPMQKINAKQWALTVPLEPGEYAYNFVVDGRPIRDPNNPKVCDIGRGFKNSLLKVKHL